MCGRAPARKFTPTRWSAETALRAAWRASAGWAPLETIPLLQAIVPLPKDMAADTVRVWFVPQDTPYFYWLIPESPRAARSE